MKQGIHFEHQRVKAGKWQTLRPYGKKHPEKEYLKLDMKYLDLEKLKVKIKNM